MRNLLCLLPDGHMPVTYWAPHPCGGYYMHQAWVYGSNGIVGYWMDAPPPAVLTVIHCQPT